MSHNTTMQTGVLKIDLALASFVGLTATLGQLTTDINLQRLAWGISILVGLCTLSKMLFVDFKIHKLFKRNGKDNTKNK